MSRQWATSGCQTVIAFYKCPEMIYVGALNASVGDCLVGESQTGDGVLWVRSRMRPANRATLTEQLSRRGRGAQSACGWRQGSQGSQGARERMGNRQQLQIEPELVQLTKGVVSCLWSRVRSELRSKCGVGVGGAATVRGV